MNYPISRPENWYAVIGNQFMIKIKIFIDREFQREKSLSTILFDEKVCRTLSHCVELSKSKLKGNNFCCCDPGLQTNVEFLNRAGFFLQIKSFQCIKMIWSQKSWMKWIKKISFQTFGSTQRIASRGSPSNRSVSKSIVLIEMNLARSVLLI